MATPAWIELTGVANARDLGGLPTRDGGSVRPHRLLRSANLQRITPEDIALLIDGYGLRAVADLRTGVELDNEGPGPLVRDGRVPIEHLSLFPEAGRNTDAGAVEAGPAENPGVVVLPWQTRDTDLGDDDRRGASAVYLRYLDDRADSIVAALRLIGRTDGATLVHCAAGKDRTGVVIALALAEVGVEREAIVADYAATADRIQDVFASLAASATYSHDMATWDYAKHTPRAVTMERTLDGLHTEFGGADPWLRQHGWTDTDAEALRHRLLD